MEVVKLQLLIHCEAEVSVLLCTIQLFFMSKCKGQ